MSPANRTHQLTTVCGSIFLFKTEAKTFTDFIKVSGSSFHFYRNSMAFAALLST